MTSRTQCRSRDRCCWARRLRPTGSIVGTEISHTSLGCACRLVEDQARGIPREIFDPDRCPRLRLAQALALDRHEQLGMKQLAVLGLNLEQELECMDGSAAHGRHSESGPASRSPQARSLPPGTRLLHESQGRRRTGSTLRTAPARSPALTFEARC